MADLSNYALSPTDLADAFAATLLLVSIVATATVVVAVLAFIVMSLLSGRVFGGDEGAIRGMLETHAKAMSARDVDAYMVNIASEAPEREALESVTRQLAAYGLRYTLEDVNILNLQNGRGVVRVVLTTVIDQRPILSGLWTIQDNRSTIEHTVVKESEGWKILSSRVISSEPLSGSR